MMAKRHLPGRAVAMQLFLMIGDEVFYDVLDAQSPKQKPTNKVKNAFFHYFTVSLNFRDWKILLQK